MLIFLSRFKLSQCYQCSTASSRGSSTLTHHYYNLTTLINVLFRQSLRRMICETYKPITTKKLLPEGAPFLEEGLTRRRGSLGVRDSQLGQSAGMAYPAFTT
jgi:hypothetical protein